MSSDLDNVLQSLEQQVKDFSMDISTNQAGAINNDIVSHQQTTRQTDKPNSHHSRSGRSYKTQQQESDDDDDIIGHLLQSPTFPSTPSSTSKSILDQQPSSASLKKIGLARSLSSSTRKFPKKLLPAEPVPCIPFSSSTSSPSNCATNTSTAPPPPATTNVNTTTDTQNDADDLQQAMQLAWAVLDAEPSDGQTKEPSPSPPQDETKLDPSRQQATNNHGGPTTGTSPASLTTVTPTQTMTTRIFIEDAKNHKTVQLTNVLTTAMVIQYLKRKELLDNSSDWTLFEIANSHGVERPLRLWEIVMDITGCWEQNTNNALLVKKYGFYETLTMDTIRDRPSPVHGWLNIEYKKGKWQKRYCFIKDHAIHHSKDSKCANSAILCHLTAFDVYTLLQPSTTCPTPFVFALRAQDRPAIFEKEHDYIRLFTAENQSGLETWVLGIRQAKSIIQYQQHPKRVQNPLAALTTATATSSSGGGDAGLRRYKSTKREPASEDTTNASNAIEGRSRSMSRSESTTRRITDETIKRKASTRGLSRSGTTRNREHHDAKDTNGPVTSAPATEEGTTNSTLIQIEDKLQFSKGSLLDKSNIPMAPTSTAGTTATTASSNTNHHHHHHHHHQPTQNISNSSSNSNGSGNRTMISRSKSTRETSTNGHHLQHRSRADDGVLSHHTSIRRKDRGQRQQQQHDVPLPNTNAIMTSSSGNPLSTSSRNNTDNTLLKLNNTPERFHTQTLLQRQMKPLLNFDQDLPSDHRR